MAKNPFSNTTKKKASTDDSLFQAVLDRSYQRSVESRRKTSPAPSAYQSKAAKPTVPTVSSTVGNHTSNYGQYAGSKPVTITTATDTAKRKQEIESRLDEIQREYSTTASVLSGYQRGGMQKSNAYEIAKSKADALLNERGELENELKNIREQMVSSGEYRDATLKDITVNAVKQGYYNSLYGRESYKDMMGNDNEKQKYEDILAGEDYQFVGGNGFEEAIAGAANLLGQQASQWTDKRALTLALGAGGTAAVAGQLGPQVLVPEEIVTVPSAMLAGLQAGSAMSNFEIEAGLAYNEMLENGVSPETAKKIALAVGGVNAGLELVQMDELTKSFKILKNSPATEAAADSLGKRLLDVGIDVTKSVGKETAQEVAQEATTIHGVQQATKMDTGEKAYTSEEVLGRLGDTAKSSALSFGIMNVPHIAAGTHNAVRADRVGSNYNADIDALIEEGLQSDQNSESYEMASALKARLDNGGSVSNTEAYDLAVANARAIETETKLQAANNPPAVESTVESSVETTPVQSRVATIQTKLTESGMEATQAETVATSIDRILSGDTSVTNKDKNVLSVGNNVARAIFEEETGVKLPASNSSTRKAISEYIAQTAMKQHKQEAPVADVENTVTTQSPVNVMSTEAINQLKGNTFGVAANSAEAKLRMAAEIASARSKVDNDVTVQSDMASLGTNGQRVYAKHLGNANSVTGYSNAFQRYYDAGQIGLPFESIKTAYDDAADRSVLFEAYSAGQNDASATGKGKVLPQKKVAQKGVKKPSRGKGKFYDTRSSDSAYSASVSREIIKTLERFAKVFNVDIELVDSITDSKGRSIANGYYKDGKIVLAADSDNPLITVLKHEVTHHLQKTSPKQYRAFKDYVMKAFYQNSQEAMNAEIQRRIDLAALNKVKLTRADAMDEIVADATESFLTDRDSIDALVRENRSLAETILNAIRDVLKKIESAMKGEKLNGYSDFMNADQLKQAEKMWVEALAAAAAGTEVGVNFAEITESSAPIWSLKSMKFDLLEGQMQRDLVEHGIMTAEESQHLMDEISKLIDHMSPFARIVDMNEEYSKGNRPFNVYKPNSDPLYKVSLDFSTLCKKRLMTQFVMESLQTKLGKALSAKEQLAIRSKLEEYGKVNQQIQVACALCYVEARRLKAPDQINRFLDDRTTILTDYFGKKNKEYKASVDEMADRMKVDLGYKADTKLKDMKPADKKKVNTAKQKMMKEYTPTAEEQKIIERANAIDNKEFLSQAGLTNMSLNDPVIYDAFVSHVRNATKSKALESGVPYYYGDSKSVADSLIEAMNAENGLRHQSWSDFEIVHLLDNIAAVIELSVRKAKMHAYTKVPDFVRVNGKTGIMINLSLIPAGKTGIKDGKLDFSPTEGMDYGVAVELRDQYHKTTGTIAIGIDDQQIEMMLNDPTIDYVIPYHTSGMNAQLRMMAGISGWADYESFQSEKEIKGAKQGECPDELWHKKPDFSEWFDTSKLDMSKSGVEIMREAAGRYLVLCEERGLHPKFSDTKKHTDFSKHENYWKLLIDRKMVDKDGNIIIQQAVRPDFDFDLITKVVDEEVANYDPTLLDSINEMISKEWESGGIKQREAELLKEEKAKKKANKKAAKVANGLLEQVVAPDQAQKNTTDDGGGKYSYESLVKKDPIMVVTVKERPIPVRGKKLDTKAIEKDARSRASVLVDANGKSQRYVRIPDINGDVLLRPKSVVHGVLGNKTNSGTMATAEISGDLVNILRNSIAVNEKKTRGAEDGDFSYILFGYAKHENGKEYIVKSTVNHFAENKSVVDSVEIYDVLKGSKAKKMETELINDQQTAGRYNGSDSNYTLSVADLLDVVKENYPELLPKDVLSHYGISEDVQEDGLQYSLKDSAGNTLTKEQAEYFKDSKVRDENGNLMVMYHGTNTPNFTVFDPSFSDDKISLFFTSSPNVADSYTTVQQGGRNLDPYRLPKTIKTMEEYNKYMEDTGSETRIVQVTDAVIEKARRDVEELIRKDKRNDYYSKRVDELESIKGKYIHHNGGMNYITRRDAVYDTAEELIQKDTSDTYWTPHRFGSRYSVYLNMERPYILDAGKRYKGTGELEIDVGFENTGASFSVNGESFYIKKGYKESFEDFARRFLSEKEADKFIQKIEERREKFIQDEMALEGTTREDVISFWAKHGGVEVEAFTYEVKKASIDYTESGVWKNLEWEGNVGTTRDLAKWAKDHKYDGVILKNLRDIGGYSGGTVTEAATIAIAFDSNQVKATNNANPTSDPDIRYQLKTPEEMLDISKQIAEVEHKAKAVTDADIMSQAIRDIAKTDAEKKIVGDYQRAMKTLADYEKQLAVYEETKAEHGKGRSIYTDASGKVKKSGVKYSAAEKAEIQRKAEWWKRRLREIEQKEEFKKILKREKAKMAETHAKKMSDLRAKYDQRLNDVRAKRDEKIEAEKQKMRDYKQFQRDSKEYKALKSKLEADVKWLDERLRHPTDAKHIPEDFRKGVAAFLKSLDFETKYTDAYTVRNGVPSQKVIDLRAMREVYENILKDQSSTMELDEIQLEALRELEKICANKRVADLDYAELGLVRDAIQYIKMSVAVADKAFNAEIKESISAMGEALIQEQRSKKAKKDRAGILGEADKLMNYDNVSPADKFHEFGGVMEKLYHQIRKGFDKHIGNVQTAISYTQKLTEGNEAAIKSWSGDKAKTTKFQISDGTTIELTPAQVMSLYCLMKRDQAVGHVLGSGIVPSGVVVKEAKKFGKLKVNMAKKVSAERSSRCTVEDIQNIVGTLTDEQKKIADGVVKLFTTKCADWGNETSMKLYGYKKFNEPNYFPIRSSDAYLNARFDDSGDVLIKNLGFTKNTVVNANNPIVVEDIFDVLADHVNKMSMYNALVVPLTDFTRVFNYKSKDTDNTIYDSVQKALETSGGSLGIAYIKQFMKDVNKQANSLAAESFINQSISRYKKAKIAASARVLLQQPTSISRAAAMVDPKYLIKGLQQKANYEEMFEHSEIAYWKSLGFYQTDMGRNMKDILLDNETTLDRLTMGMYGKADDFAWAHLWNAIKLEQADAHPDMDTTSSEFLGLVADRFDAVVDRTQVVDSVFHRSQIMRAQGAATKVATAFMSESTKGYNLLRTDLIDSINSKDYSKIKRSAVTYVANAILVSVFAGIADMIRDDEDEDDEGNKRNLWDKYRDAVSKNVMDNINPLGMIPYLKDVNSMIQGYDVNRMEMASLAEFVKTVKKWAQGKHSYPYLIKETAEDISELFGIPLKNAVRDVTALVRTAGDIVGGHYYADYAVDKMKYNISNPDNRSVFYKHYTDALLAGDKKAADAILADMVVNGIPYENIVSRGYQKQKEVAFSEARKLIAAGKTSEAKSLIRKLAREYDKEYTALWKAVKNGYSADEPEETYDFKDLKKAIRKGEDTELIEDYLTEYGGYSEEDLEEAIKMLTGEK